MTLEHNAPIPVETEWADVSLPLDNKFDGEIEIWANIASNFTPNMFANLLMQAIGDQVDEGITKSFWLEVAETLGPDHCQTLYHGAVFASKVA